MSGAGRNDTPETAAARAGADIEVTAQHPPADLPGSRLDQQAVNAAREALPGWHVQPEQLVRTVTAPAGAGPAALRGALEQVARDAGRVPEITVDRDEVTVRLRTAGGAQAALALAAALDPVLSGSQARGPDPAGR